jgi:hypothetical protein
MSTENVVPASEGYPRLASVMGPCNLGIFKKFAELNALNILHLQAELVYLEQELRILMEMDNTSGDSARKLYIKSAYALRKSADGRNDHQWRKLLAIREKLKEYSKTTL